MFSKNFYYRIKYQIDKNAIFEVFYQFFLDRIKHPFVKNKKNRLKKIHQNYLQTKKTTTDYFSINTFYWDSIISKNFKEFSYLEIGSFEGNSALYILKNFKTKKVICIDVWDKFDDKDKDENLKIFESFNSNLNEFLDRFSFFKSTSDEYFKKNNEKFDIIYIDGWHEAPQVYKDLNNSWNSLNTNGLIICDDYFYGDLKLNANSNLPANAINQFLSEKKDSIKILCVNNNQIFIKKLI
ncbi:class I SAM-dependent methyltransferase [Candidatus Pelagibacter sp.]|nr:class I SAM-dependent methyltransferase [Candidatus Pelagibacter sp.]